MADAPRSDSAAKRPSFCRASRPLIPFVSMESPANVQADGSSLRADERRICEWSPPATLKSDGQCALMDAGRVAGSETGAAANLARVRRLGHRNEISEGKGFPRVTTYPASARFKFGDGRLGEVRCAADTPAGIAGSRCECAGFALEADIPGPLRRGGQRIWADSWISVVIY